MSGRGKVQIILTNEFKMRLKQRLGLKRRAAMRHAQKVLDYGEAHGDYLKLNDAVYTVVVDDDVATFITVLVEKSEVKVHEYHGGEFARVTGTSRGKFECVKFKRRDKSGQ